MTNAKLPPYRVLSEPTLAFDPHDPAASMTHPLRGLIQFGPYSKRAHPVLGTMIRVATIGPTGSFARIAQLFRQLNEPQQVQERRDYLPEYPGSAKVLGIQVGPAGESLRTELPKDLIEVVRDAPPGPALAAAILGILRQYLAQREQFDVVAIHLPESWAAAFRSDDGFDLHDAIKAGAAMLGVPTQILNDDVWTYRCRASVAWRLSIALYSKYGGNPWKITPSPTMLDTAYIGLAYARRGRPEDGKYVTCCSQVFDADGGGMQFIAFDIGDGVDLKNPFLSREQMRSVMARSIALYQRRNSGVLPRRVVIHKTSPFTDDELAGTGDALMGVREFECVKIQSRVSWRAVKLNAPRATPGPKSLPDSYPVRRGTVVHMSGRSALLWTGGNVPDPQTGRNYFKAETQYRAPCFSAALRARET